MAMIALIVTVLGISLAPLVEGVSGSSGAAQPRLWMVDKAPLVLRGTGFARAERVKVTVLTPQAELVRRTLASRLGRFVVRLDTVVDACYGARAATAVGGRGSKASIVLERPVMRECVELSGSP